MGYSVLYLSASMDIYALVRYKWIELKREDRICGQCGLREVEDVEHCAEVWWAGKREGSADEK